MSGWPKSGKPMTTGEGVNGCLFVVGSGLLIGGLVLLSGYPGLVVALAVITLLVWMR